MRQRSFTSILVSLNLALRVCVCTVIVTYASLVLAAILSDLNLAQTIFAIGSWSFIFGFILAGILGTLTEID